MLYYSIHIKPIKKKKRILHAADLDPALAMAHRNNTTLRNYVTPMPWPWGLQWEIYSLRITDRIE